MTYDGSEDVLEVTFGEIDERFTQSVALCDTVFIFTDLSRQSIWGLTIYNYISTLELDFLCLENLKLVSIEQANVVANLLKQAPIDKFFKITDSELYHCKLLSPSLDSLIGS